MIATAVAVAALTAAVVSPAQAATCSGTSGYDSVVLQDSPVGYWRLGSTGSTVTDCGTGTHVAQHFGTRVLTTLPNGDNATDFSGNTRYVTVNDADDLSITRTGVLTIEAWMRPDVLQFPYQESNGYVHWMGKGTPGQHEYAARMYSRTNGENRPNRISGYSFNLTGGLGAGSYFQDPVTAGQWIHYMLVVNTRNTSSAYPTGYTKVYKNGVLRDTDRLKDYNIVPGNGTAPLRIGTRDFSSFFDGAIGKVAVYDFELSAGRALAHYNAM